jgi:hypothetical protein
LGFRESVGERVDPRVERITLDLGFNRLLGPNTLGIKWGPRPDVGIFFKSGQVKVWEVGSKTDDLRFLFDKNANLMRTHGINGTAHVFPFLNWAYRLMP